MLKIDTLAKNKNVYNPDSDLQTKNIGIWDLTRSSINYTGVNVQIKSYKIVPDDYVMRPDRFAFSAYGDLAYTGTFLKFNGISNPFAMNSGDLVVFPLQAGLDAALDAKSKLISKGSGAENPNSKFRKSQEQRRFKTSDSRKKFLEMRNKAKNTPTQVLPSNILQDGERQTVRTNAVIALGPDVSNASPNPNANL